MVSQDFSGREIVSVLRTFGYRRDRTRGDHVILKYTHPGTGEQRTVTVPLHDRIRVDTFRASPNSAARTTFASGVGG